MNGRCNVLAAAFDPFHWASGLFRQIADKTILGVEVNFASKGASDFRGDDARLVFGDLEHVGKKRSETMRRLRGAPDDEFVVWNPVGGNHSPRLHGDRRQPLIDQPLFHDHVGFFECLFRVSTFKEKVERNVVGEFFVEAGTCGIHGLLRIDHYRKRFVVDLDQIGGISRNVLVLCDHGGNRFSDKTNFIRCQGVP